MKSLGFVGYKKVSKMVTNKSIFILTDKERDFLSEKGNGNMSDGLRLVMKESGFHLNLECIEDKFEEPVLKIKYQKSVVLKRP